MDQQRVQMFLMSNQKYFEPAQIPMISQQLQNMDENTFMMISAQSYKDPTTLLIVSLFLGSLGIDRFMLGDIGIGVLKLLTFGCFGILTIIDWFVIMGKARQKNMEMFMNAAALANATSAQFGQYPQQPQFQPQQQYQQPQQYQQQPPQQY